jgi:cytochrome c oxidase assembly protein subunit 15
MENGVQYEHTHRLVASAVGLMTIVLAILLVLRKDRGLFKLGAAAAVLVVFQGVLGGITVLYQLPRAISIAHLATSMCFFSLTIVIALRTAPALPEAPREATAERPWLGMAWALLLVQIVLGGLVRHTASGLACLDVPLCHGEFWPALPPERVQMLHRLGAVFTGVFAIGVALRVRRRAGNTAWLRWLSLVPVTLVVVQIGLGLTSVLSLLDLTVITAHLAVGAALLGSFVLIFGLLPAPRAVAPASALGPDPRSSDAVVAS